MSLAQTIAALSLVGLTLPALGFEPRPLDGTDYVMLTLAIVTIVLLSAMVLALRNYRWLSYGAHAALLLLLATSLDGTLAWMLGLGPEFMRISPLLIGAITAGFGWFHTALHIEAPHPFTRLKIPFRGFAVLSVALIPAYLMLDTMIPLYSALNTLMLLMIISSVLPPMTWQSLSRFEHGMAIAMPLGFITLVVSIYGMHFLGDGFERATLDDFNRFLGFLYLSYALGFALYYLSKRARAARQAEQRAESAAREAAEAALALSEAQRDFEKAQMLARDRSRQLAEASHDIRQPIASMRRAAEALRTQEGVNGAEDIVRAAEYLSELAQSYLVDDHNDPTAGGELQRDADGQEVVKSSLLTNAALQLHRLEANALGVALEVDDAGYFIAVQPLLVVRALSNLIANALAHSQATKVTLRAEPHNNGVAFVVEDNGVGIADALRATLLLPGEKGRLSDGQGLGLAIVAGLAEQHDWALDLHNSSKGGLRAVLTVPAAKPR